MTLVVVILIGLGTVFIGSAMDNTPIVSTFQKILSGQTINWTGAQAPAKTSGSGGVGGPLGGIVIA